MTKNARKMLAAVVLVAATLAPVSPPAHARNSPAAMPAQTTRNISLALPIGTIELIDARLQVSESAGKIPEGFRGTARVKLPAVGPLANLRMSDLLRADVGLDKGSELTAFGAPLDPDRRYLFLSFGGGLNISREFEDRAGDPQTIDLTVPPGEQVVLIIDPEQPLIFVQGKFKVNYTGDLAVISQLLASRGISVPGLENVKLPGAGTIVISGTLAPGTDKSFIELSAGTGFGKIGAAFGLQAEPLSLQGGARIDKDGVTITGATSSKVVPDKVLDSSGKVQMHVPFNGQQPFVDLTGALSVPLAQAQAEGSERFTLDGQAIADAVRFTFDEARSTVKTAGDAITVTVGSAIAAGGSAATSAGNVFTVTVGQAAQSGGTVLAGVKDVLSNTVGAASPVISGVQNTVSDTLATAPATLDSGWQDLMQQICKATGRC